MVSTKDIKGFMLDSLTKVAALILVSAIIMVTVISADTILADISEKKIIEDLRSNWTDSNVKTVDGTYYDFVKLGKTNPDISGWLKIGGTEINNPVCLYRENDYYSTRNYLNKSSDYGSLYFGSGTNFEANSKNTVIYGNNLQNGEMFSDLIKYKNKKFAEKSQTIKLTTKNTVTEYEVFAVLTLSDDPSHEKENVSLDYARTEFADEYDFVRWISQIKLRSLYDSNLIIDFSDRVLTLVTDSYEFPSAKLVIFARAVNDGTIVGANPLTINSEPKLPYIWYQIHDLESPYHYSAQYIVPSN